jgi:protein involved in polysaccharide export with SLBB domain
LKFLSILILLPLLVACTSYPQAQAPITLKQGEYRLRENDVVHLRVYDEPDFNGDFKVDSTGNVSLPLAGKINIRNQTEQQAARTIETGLKQSGLLKNPKVSVEVFQARPFYILGEVDKPGTFPFQTGLTVYQAVATAGGFTYRADRHDITIRRQTENGAAGAEQRYSATEDTPIFPGDSIEIGERYF